MAKKHETVDGVLYTRGGEAPSDEVHLPDPEPTEAARSLATHAIPHRPSCSCCGAPVVRGWLRADAQTGRPIFRCSGCVAQGARTMPARPVAELLRSWYEEGGLD